jgi:hypothetical protein
LSYFLAVKPVKRESSQTIKGHHHHVSLPATTTTTTSFTIPLDERRAARAPQLLQSLILGFPQLATSSIDLSSSRPTREQIAAKATIHLRGGRRIDRSDSIILEDMAWRTAAAMARAVLVAVVLMQCCNVIVAARPLLEATTTAVAGSDGGWLGLLLQVLPKGGPSGPSGGNRGGWNGGHP